MILAVDVQYVETTGYVAGVAFEYWTDEIPTQEYVSIVEETEEYKPGEFYLRELPCLLRLLTEHSLSPHTIVVDGYVFLDGSSRPGLGKHLYDALAGEVTVVGVAKRPFDGIGDDYQVYRGDSVNPLFVTSQGMDLELTKQNVRSMSGKHRIPTLLKRVDQLCREEARKHKGSLI